MLRLIAYDIHSEKRLRKIAKICLDYGIRAQFSVFECDLEEKHAQRFWERIMECIDPGEDSVMMLPVCESCVKNIRIGGKAYVYEKPKVYLF